MSWPALCLVVSCALALATCGGVPEPDAVADRAPADGAGSSAPALRFVTPTEDRSLPADPEPFVYPVDPYLWTISFWLSFDQDTEPILEVKTPSGVSLTREGAPTSVDATWQIEEPSGNPELGRVTLTVKDPQPGAWKAFVDGQDRDLDSGMRLRFHPETWYRLHVESTAVFVPGCSACVVFEVFLESDFDSPPPGAANVVARGRGLHFVDAGGGWSAVADAWDMGLVDDGSGLDKVAADGRFTSRLWPPTSGETTIMVDLTGTIEGFPFERSFIQTYGGDRGRDQYAHVPVWVLAELELGLGDRLDVTAELADREIRLGGYAMVEVTPDWDTKIEWLEPTPQTVAALESPAAAKVLETLTALAWMITVSDSAVDAEIGPESGVAAIVDAGFGGVASLRDLASMLFYVQEMDASVEIHVRNAP